MHEGNQSCRLDWKRRVLSCCQVSKWFPTPLLQQTAWCQDRSWRTTRAFVVASIHRCKWKIWKDKSTKAAGMIPTQKRLLPTVRKEKTQAQARALLRQLCSQLHRRTTSLSRTVLLHSRTHGVGQALGAEHAAGGAEQAVQRLLLPRRYDCDNLRIDAKKRHRGENLSLPTRNINRPAGRERAKQQKSRRQYYELVLSKSSLESAHKQVSPKKKILSPQTE
eukprot:SAG31_NODE_483_length_15042_cov_28.867764_4_plen_221_part_00